MATDPIEARLAELTPELVAWRHHLHAHPELAFEEHGTAAFIADKLRAFGLEVHEGIGRTGVVGVLRNGNGPMVALRADIDALPITETTGLPYASTVPGRMHACGHDGHTTMLLGAARVLCEHPPANGTVVFIFQPAEENEGGGKAMVEAGLFRDFPAAAVYGMHNWPGLPPGQFAVRAGPIMAAFDTFELVIEGQGSHGAMPHQGIDPIAVSAELYFAWQLLVSRSIDPTDAAVISVTQIHAGDTWNVVPDGVTLRGTVRTLKPSTRDMLEQRMGERADFICRAFGARARLTYQRRYPATINSAAESEIAQSVAAEIGQGEVLTDLAPSMAAEDFSYMLQEKPGAYVWIGNGPAQDGRNLHSPRYDFNDAILPVGAAFWVKLAHRAIAGD